MCLVGGSRGGENRCLKTGGHILAQLPWASKALNDTLLEAAMRHCVDSYVFPGVFAPILSLEELSTRFDAPTGAASFEIPDSGPTCDIEAEHAEAREAVAHFIGKLSQRDRQIVRSLFWEGESQTVVARRFGVSKMAISKAFSRIAKLGRVALAPHEHIALIN